ncbi:DUF2304 domain-containing protein [Stieleria varia]|uniref:DUF2304 domain-containing protein n=1 Tax=Stieleria varia TaxID=2528005 RepID=A0A5C6B9H6_9BACT|nr:DUF2304 domain-containing protein [Stieleria varia]TWU07969.1 hypothetical protein Pla52n_05460 [Stieleria varia]
MLIIQWLIIPFAIVIAVHELIAFMRVASRLRLLHAVLWAAVAVLVWRPSLVQAMADWVNVGRGADFVLYGLVVYTILFTFYVLQNQERQRQLVTDLVRDMAIRDADFSGAQIRNSPPEHDDHS